MVVMIVVVVLVVLPGIGVWLAFRYIGHKAEQIVGSGSCTLVSDATAGNGLGEPVTLRSGTGLGGVVSGLIDSRVLPNAPSCYGTFEAPGGSSSGGLVRVAVYSGSDGKGGLPERGAPGEGRHRLAAGRNQRADRALLRPVGQRDR
jgi:hypothetical protein